MDTKHLTFHPTAVALFGEVLADVFPDQSVLGGAPFNVARHLQVLGSRPVMVSRIGNDALGEALLAEMASLHMETIGMQRDADHPTGQVRVMLKNDTHRFDILPDQAYDFIQTEPMRTTLRAIPPKLAYFGTLAQRNAVSREAAQNFLHECNCPVFLDINLRAPWFDTATISSALAATDIVKLNDEELATVAELLGLSALDEIAQARALQQRFKLEQVLVTCGEAGCWLLDVQQQVWKAAPLPDTSPVVDTVGAGDAFAAMFIHGLLQGSEMQATLQRACDYASAQCRIRGAAPSENNQTYPHS